MPLLDRQLSSLDAVNASVARFLKAMLLKPLPQMWVLGFIDGLAKAEYYSTDLPTVYASVTALNGLLGALLGPRPRRPRPLVLIGFHNSFGSWIPSPLHLFVYRPIGIGLLSIQSRSYANLVVFLESGYSDCDKQARFSSPSRRSSLTTQGALRHCIRTVCGAHAA